jgi:invasion protein IalB
MLPNRNLSDVLLSALCIALAAGLAAAQPPTPSIVPPNPQSPTINLPQPLGALPGASVEITLTGGNLTDPLSITGLPGKATFPTDANNTKDPAKLRVKVEIPAGTPVGMYPLRLVTKQGVSNMRPFCIDDLPVGPTGTANRSLSTAVSLPVPSVATGRIDVETSEFYRISVKPGQRVCIEVLARRLGSALDPIILMHDGKAGHEIPSLYSDDAPGCQTDSRLTHTFKEGGDFVIEVRDSTHRGGGDFFYRLRVGDFPSAITPMPLAAKRGSKASINFAGPDLDGVTPVPLDVTADSGLEAISLVPKGSRPNSGWPVSLLLSDYPEVEEREPNNEPASANRVPVPCGISGRFQTRSDQDCFVFTAKKGQRVLINSQTTELLSPAGVYMMLKDAKGGQVAVSNPMADTGIDYTAPADGDLILVVEHLNYLHGPNEVYRITITEPGPSFEVTLSADRIEIPLGGVAVLPIQTLTRKDYGGPVEVSVVGPPGLTGTTTITAAAPAAPNLPIGVLAVNHSGSAPVTGTLRVVAKATINGKEVKSFAEVTPVVRQTMAGLLFPPRSLSTDIAVTTTEPPFKLIAKYAHPEAAKGTALPLTVTATRAAGFAEDIALTVVGLPPNVAAAAKPIPKAANSIEFPVTPAAAAPVGTFGLVVIGKGKFQNREFAVTAPAVLTVAPAPFALSASALPPLKPGDKAKLKVTAARKGGFAGPIDVELKNLPAGVTAPKTPIAAGKNDVEVEVTAAVNAAVGDKADVNVTGTAAGQTAATPNFKLTVLAAPAPAVAPFALTAVAPPALKSGDKVKVKVTAMRKDYAGPIDLEVKNLPAGVTAPKSAIPAGKNDVEIELTAAATAAPAEKADVNVTGTAAGKSAATPNFKVSVVKK